MPIRGGDDALKTNWCEIIVTDENDKILYHNCFITNIEINDNNVVDITSYGRARWKIKNENNNTLKTKGYHIEHNFGHGKQYLSQTLFSLNLLAFLIHTIQEFIDELYIELRALCHTRIGFFDAIRTISSYIIFKNYESMLEWMIISKKTRKNIDLTPYI